MLPGEISKLVTGDPVKTVVLLSNNPHSFETNLKLVSTTVQLTHKSGAEEFSASHSFGAGAGEAQVFEESVESYARAMAEGFNVGLVVFGGQETPKAEVLEGGKGGRGMVSRFAESLFSRVEARRGEQRARGREVSFRVVFSAAELLEEGVVDLLGGPGGRVEDGEWEGAKLAGCVEAQVGAAGRVVELLSAARERRSRATGEFGPLRHKAAAIFSLQLLQVVGEESVGVWSKALFVETPATDVLLEDSERVVEREGPGLNRAAFQLRALLTGLASGRPSAGLYEGSPLTLALRDVFGGNCYTVVMLCLTQGDFRGSLSTLRLARSASRVINFPLLNEANALGLLRTLRLEARRARGAKAAGDAIETSERVSAEQQGVTRALGTLAALEDRERLAERLEQLKAQLAASGRARAALQEELLSSEEEKLKLGKALVELQAESARMAERGAGRRFDDEQRLVGAETQLLAAGLREEKATGLVVETRAALETALADKRDLETELMVIRRNLADSRAQAEQTQAKLDAVELELVAQNAKRRKLEEQLDGFENGRDRLTQAIAVGEQKREADARQLDTLRAELAAARAAAAESREAVLRLQAEAVRNQATSSERGLETQKDLLYAAKKFDADVRDVAAQASKLRAERGELLAKLRAATRRADEAVARADESERLVQSLQSENSKLTTGADEMRAIFRAKLLGFAQDPARNFLNAREDLLRNYSEREVELNKKSQTDAAEIARLRRALAEALKKAADFRALAEENGAPIPNSRNFEVSPLESSEPFDALGPKGLSKTPETLGTVGAQRASRLLETPEMQAELESLRVQNATLLAQLQAQNGRLPPEQKNLAQKIFYLEKTVQTLEIERSSLLSRALLAEEALKSIQNHRDNLKNASLAKTKELRDLLG